MALEQEHVFRLDIAVDHVRAVQVIEHLGHLARVGDQFIQRHGGQAGRLAVLEPLPQCRLGQLHGDVHPPVYDPEGVDLGQKGMAQGLDQFQGLDLTLHFLVIDRPTDDLDCHRTAAGAAPRQTSLNMPPPRYSSFR